MRTIERSARFRRDYKRESRGRYQDALEADLVGALRLLALDEPLPPRFHDHALTGNWLGFRDCHIKPDLILIYRKLGSHGLELARLGTHSELDLS